MTWLSRLLKRDSVSRFSVKITGASFPRRREYSVITHRYKKAQIPAFRRNDVT